MVNWSGQKAKPIPAGMFKFQAGSVIESKEGTVAYYEVHSVGNVKMDSINAKSVEDAVKWSAGIKPKKRNKDSLTYEEKSEGIKCNVNVYIKPDGILIESDPYYPDGDKTAGRKLNLATKLAWKIANAIEGRIRANLPAA